MSNDTADKDQQESRVVAGKPHDAVEKFDTYQNLQRHRAVLPALARLSCLSLYLQPSQRVRSSIKNLIRTRLAACIVRSSIGTDRILFLNRTCVF